MIDSKSFLNMENVDVTPELLVANPIDTPLMTYLLGIGNVDKETSPLAYFREKSLDTTDNISIKEGADADTFVQSTRTPLSNYCEIFRKATQVSGTAEASTVTGIGDMFAEELADRLTEIKVAMEKNIINGTKADGSASDGIRHMDGILNFVDTGNQLTGTSLKEADFKNTVKVLWSNGLGSNGFIALCNSDIKDTIDGFYSNQYNYTAPTGDFGLVANTINTNYGNVKLMLDRHIPEGKLVVFAPEFIRLGFLRQPFSEILAKTGDSIKGEVIAEGTIKVLNKKAISTFTI